MREVNAASRTCLWARMLVPAVVCAMLLAAPGVARAGETTIQGTQRATSVAGASGEVTGSNAAGFKVGASASGPVSASAQQSGPSTASVRQKATGGTGDVLAGTQVSGAVGPNVSVQNANDAVVPVALSGAATTANLATVTLGPVAESTLLAASASQTGDNSLVAEQSASSTTGDALAGAQVTGIADDGQHTVSTMNRALCLILCAESEQAESANDLRTALGPQAVSPLLNAQASQAGDNDAGLSQSSAGSSGDALFGSQVAGVVGGSAGIQQSNRAVGIVLPDDDAATSGGARTKNTMQGALSAVAVGPFASSALTSATASQTGDNTATTAQRLSASIGDAMAGTQVTGAVGPDDSTLSVQQQQATAGATAFGGSDSAVNCLGGNQDSCETNGFDVGPGASGLLSASSSQFGDNSLTATQAKSGSTGDAVSGSQVTGGVGHAVAGVNNSNAAVLARASSRADSVAGSQITGIVAEGIVDVQNANTAAASLALTREGGASAYSNVVDTAVGAKSAALGTASSSQAGDNVVDVNQRGRPPVAVITAGARADAIVRAQASQSGDNDVTLAQDGSRGSSDAVAGSQITGVVVDGGTVNVGNMNRSLLNAATSGDATSELAGLPAAAVLVGASAVANTASAQQSGDNVLDASQRSRFSTGDAVSGSQVTGVVGGPSTDATVQTANRAVLTVAVSGSVAPEGAMNLLVAQVGTTAVGFLGQATASQTGDDTVTFEQDAGASTGDAVAGSQVTGLVGGAGSRMTSQPESSSVAVLGLAGSVVSASNVAGGHHGVLAVSLTTARAMQAGDTAIDSSQKLTAEGGDAVSGTQIAGRV